MDISVIYAISTYVLKWHLRRTSINMKYCLHPLFEKFHINRRVSIAKSIPVTRFKEVWSQSDECIEIVYQMTPKSSGNSPRTLKPCYSARHLTMCHFSPLSRVSYAILLYGVPLHVIPVVHIRFLELLDLS